MIANETPYKDEIGTFELSELSKDFELTTPKAIPSGSKTQICGITFSQNGNNLVFATDSGTMIRGFNIVSNSMLYDFCRGRNAAVINSISGGDNFISCTSDHGTTHIFKVSSQSQSQLKLTESTEEAKEKPQGNTKSILSMVPLIGSRFNTEYAFAKINREASDESGEVCVVKDDRIFIVTMRGQYKQF